MGGDGRNVNITYKYPGLGLSRCRRRNLRMRDQDGRRDTGAVDLSREPKKIEETRRLLRPEHHQGWDLGQDASERGGSGRAPEEFDAEVVVVVVVISRYVCAHFSWKR